MKRSGMQQEHGRADLTTQDVFRICAESGCDVKTVEAFLRGRREVRNITRQRILWAMRNCGYDTSWLVSNEAQPRRRR